MTNDPSTKSPLDSRLELGAALVHDAVHGKMPTVAALVAVFGQDAIDKLVADTLIREEPTDARFARVSLDELVNVTQARRVQIQTPTEEACVKCRESGSIVLNDRKVTCPHCKGKGRHLPADTASTVLFVWPPTDNAAPDKVHFATEAEAREYFERLALRLVSPGPVALNVQLPPVPDNVRRMLTAIDAEPQRSPLEQATNATAAATAIVGGVGGAQPPAKDKKP